MASAWCADINPDKHLYRQRQDPDSVVVLRTHDANAGRAEHNMICVYLLHTLRYLSIIVGLPVLRAPQPTVPPALPQPHQGLPGHSGTSAAAASGSLQEQEAGANANNVAMRGDVTALAKKSGPILYDVRRMQIDWQHKPQSGSDSCMLG